MESKSVLLFYSIFELFSGSCPEHSMFRRFRRTPKQVFRFCKQKNKGNGMMASRLSETATATYFVSSSFHIANMCVWCVCMVVCACACVRVMVGGVVCAPGCLSLRRFRLLRRKSGSGVTRRVRQARLVARHRKRGHILHDACRSAHDNAISARTYQDTRDTCYKSILKHGACGRAVRGPIGGRPDGQPRGSVTPAS